MTRSRPTPPEPLPETLADRLADLDTGSLRDTASYLESLAAYREQRSDVTTDLDSESSGARSDDGSEGAPVDKSEDGSDDSPDEISDDTPADSPDGISNDVSADRPDETPEGVPSKATLTQKEINDNRYYYWQWRDGDTIKSKYEGPVKK